MDWYLGHRGVQTLEELTPYSERKRIFLPVTVEVWKITVHQKDREPFTHLKVQMPKTHTGVRYLTGVGLTPSTEPPDEPDPTDLGSEFPLAGDTTGLPSMRSRSKAQSERA